MKLYNTLTRQVEEFIPLKENEVKMYTCGLTVYNYAHIGNLRTYISEDILEKTFNYLGYKVKRVMNITDVGHLESDGDDGEDKMLKGALREKKTVWEVAEHYTQAFLRDFERLNIKKPEIIAKATDHIEDYIQMIKVLEEKGYTYFSNGNVYFDISKVDDYTKLSKMNLEDLRIARREDVEEDKNKRQAQDFVLWFTQSKFQNQAMKWESPWGTGYPGWHVECSAIGLKYLGNQMDIHCGGVDHIPIHHTNEIAQTESYTGEPWVNYWWHGEFLLDKSGKMSKSKGEFLTLDRLEEKGYSPIIYRFYVINSHYRKQLTFTYESLELARITYEKMKEKIKRIKGKVNKEDAITEAIKPYQEQFKASLMDDLNVANSITAIHDVLKSTTLNNKEKIYLIEEFDQVLSIDLLKEDKIVIEEDEKRYIEEMLQKRKEAKKSKDFSLADQIRNELLDRGIEIKDTRDGTIWNKVRN